MQALIAIQAATLAARARLADETIGTRIEAGRVQVVRVTYAEDGESTVTPVSEWMPVSEAADYLGAL